MLQIRLLGQFDVRIDGKRVAISSRAGQSLLAYLALTTRTAHRREKLAGMFWPDTSDENSRKNLRQELWRIRKAITAQQSTGGDYLLADEFTLTFNDNAEYWLDVSQMERPDLDLQSLTSNLSLYQGELLPGFYDDWIVLERERIQAIFEARMEQLLEQLVVAERWIATQEWGERWLAFGKAPEPAYRALMLASGARGDMAKVASLYQRCTDELQEHLGVKPSAETRALYDGLRKGTNTPLRATGAQPSGTVTFLFTDIEESTNLLDRLGNQYAAVLTEHHEIMRAAVQKWNGREVDTQGDAFFVTFGRALDAVQCAADAQRALASHLWTQGEHVHVRMGLHTGEPLISSTGYVGMDVHRAARIGDAGHGGQVLLSQTTRELVMYDLPAGLTIQELGEHRLKDMKYPTSIYQLVIEGLPVEFPALRTKFTGTEAPTLGEAPFKGLQFFDEGDSELFFGRETLTAKLVHRLRDANFLSVIIGASGSGKSSLVRAGLVPAIKKGGALINGRKPPEGSVSWQVHIMTPTAHPLEALAIELTRDSESVTAVATLVDDLSKDPRSLHFFLSRQTQAHDVSVPRHTLLVIDQFEELFTLCRDEFEREAFIDNLLAALTPPPLPLGEARRGEGSLTLVITLRADFYAHLAQYPELREAVAQQQEYIGPMTSEELRRAIEEPAQRGHWEFEPGLVDLILRDVGDEPGALPLLSHALLETWKRRAGHRLTLKGYADAGGVHGAIAHTAESVYQNLSLSEQTIVRNILLRLTEFGEGTEDTRRRASFDELMSHTEDPDDVRAVLNTLAEARLVTLSEDTAEVAHEALIREWPKLREWLSQDREGIVLHRHLTEAAHEWELLERDAGSVYRGARLAQANEWLALNPRALNAQERRFLDASNIQAKREEQEREDQLQRELASAKELAETQHQSASRLRIRNRVITTVGILAVILAILAGVFGLQSNQNANTAQNNAATAQVAKDNALNAQATAQAARAQALADFTRADAQRLAGEANNLLLSNSPKTSLIALLAIRSLTTGYTAAGDGLLTSLNKLDVPPREFRGHTADIWGVDISPDGKYLATNSDDGDARIWDLATGETIRVFPGPISPFDNGQVKFSPDGKYLAATATDSKVRLWNIGSGEMVRIFTGCDGAGGGSVSFSPDGKRVLADCGNQTALIWDVASGQTVHKLIGATAPNMVPRAAYSADGRYVATVSAPDGEARVFDAETGTQVQSFLGPGGGGSIDISPDGRYLAFGNDHGDFKIRLWNIASGAMVREFSGHTDFVQAVRFSPDGRYLLSASNDRTAILWDVATGETIRVLRGNTNVVRDVAFSPDGSLVATSSQDRTARVWSLRASPIGVQFLGPVGVTRQASFSPDGKRVVTANVDGDARIWDAVNGQLLLTLIGHTNVVRGAVFSPDGKWVLTASEDATVRLWDATSGRELHRFEGHTGSVNRAIFSPDATYVVSAAGGTDIGGDGTSQVWDTQTGDIIAVNKGCSGRPAFSPDGKTVASGCNDGTFHIWDPLTGQDLKIFGERTTGRAAHSFFSPDGRFLCTVSDSTNGRDTPRLWDIESRQEVPRSDGAPACGLFSPDGKYFATTINADNTVILWNAQTHQEARRFPNPAAAYNVAFSPDGKYLLVSNDDGTARMWLTDLDDALSAVCATLTRDFTPEERKQYDIRDEEPTCPKP